MGIANGVKENKRVETLGMGEMECGCEERTVADKQPTVADKPLQSSATVRPRRSQRRSQRRFSDAPETVPASLQRRSQRCFSDTPSVASAPASLQRRTGDGPSVASATLRPRRSQRRFSDAQAATVPASLQRRSGSDDPSVASAK
nr:hypothetical protein CFP56_43071 [Quercus suber]